MSTYLSSICHVCNYCYASSKANGKPVCERCQTNFDVEKEPKRKCPIDGALMLKKIHEPSIVLDVCPQCSGIWIDGHEKSLMKRAAMEEGARQAMMTGFIIGAIIN